MKKSVLRWLLAFALVLLCTVTAAFAEGDAAAANAATEEGEVQAVAEKSVQASDDLVIVIDTYAIKNPTTGKQQYYARGLELDGKEVNTLIGIEGCVDANPSTEDGTAYTDATFAAEFKGEYVTFALSRDSAQMEAGVMVAQIYESTVIGYRVAGSNVLFATFADAWVYAEAAFGSGNFDVSLISEVRTPETDIKVVHGYIESNQATGENYTTVSGTHLNIETGLDMLGHFVSVYYSKAYKNEYNPGTVFALVDEAEYVEVKEDIDTRSDYLAAFGKQVEMNYECVTFDSQGWMSYDTVFTYDECSYIAEAGTYVIREGRIIAYLAPIEATVEQVIKVNNTVGKECIRIGTTLYSNTADEDCIVEYPGIAKGDIVIVKHCQYMTYVEKPQVITGKITKTGVANWKEYTYIGDTMYYNSGMDVSAVDGLVAYGYPSSTVEYNAYIYDGKLIGVEEIVRAVELYDAVYVVGTYSVEVAGNYSSVTHYYAQGVDMTGEEVSVLIGVEDLGVREMPDGFYTFELSTVKEEAQKNVMVATAAPALDTFDSDVDGFFADAVTSTLNGYALTKDDMYVIVGDGSRVMLTEQTKFILVDAESVGSELNIATYTGPIKKNVDHDNITAAATVDEFGNRVAEVVVLVTYDVALKSSSYIYVVDGSDYSAVEGGFEYTVFFTATNEFKMIVADSLYESGFYGDWTVDEDGIYDLGPEEAYDEVLLGQEFLGCFGTMIISDDIDLCDAAGAVIYDVRDEEILEESEVAEVETLRDILSAHRAGYRVFFHALVDDEDVSNPVVTHIFVYSVEAGEVDGGSTEPPVSNLPSAVYVVGTYSVEVAGNYSSVTHYYAQGVDMTGEEVSVLIGVEDLGVREMPDGFYTFELSTVKEEAQKNVMVATAAPALDTFDSDVDGFFADAVTSTLNGYALTKDDMYVIVGDGSRVMLTEQTKFILVDAESVGSELNIATYTGPINKNVDHDNITAAATVDEFGNRVAEVVVLVTYDIALKSSDYIYVVDGDDYAIVEDGYEYTVFFTDTNEFKTIVTDYWYETGFYGDWTVDEDGIYDLGAAETNSAVVCLGQGLEGFFNGRISSYDIDLYDATDAVIYDMRNGRGFSEVSLDALADALKAERRVSFHAVVDTDDVSDLVVTHIFVYSVVFLDEYDDCWYEDEDFTFVCEACEPVVGRNLGNGTHAVRCRYCGTALTPEEHVYQDGACACGALEAGQPDVPPAEVSARFVLSGGMVRPGETVQVELFLSASVPVNSIAVSGITYDTDVLTFTGFSDHEHIDELAALPPAFDEEKGAIVIGLRQAQEFDGKICSLNFKVSEDALNCDISIAGASVVKNSSVVVGSSVVPATVLVRRYLPGDINGDDAVTLEDAVLLFQNSMLPELYPVDYPGDMDFNGDGNVDLDDAVYLFNYSMLPDLYPLQ